MTHIKLFALVATLGAFSLGSEVAPLGTYTPRERSHWAFVKRATPPVPTFTLAMDNAWVKNPIDAFILQRLQKVGLRPSPPADRATLIRRVYFALYRLAPPRITVRVCRSTGSMLCSSPRPTASSTTRTAATPGATATTSSAPSTRT